ncbi:GntR family transcriptional regulator [Mesocricetibacter intestinalis]|uniref:Fatty acid metabolism regulator protein n=1 Tax=Mesocricetibacter intestinalis TaxID=1521930 RepID=A0A4V3D9N8_9PAST|nr:fatty acid metabolism transcriptional regulator FadR [Mesocricetibacter intestinalis]TDQ58037.1 GntR family transcriptional regulator [Mesocricetibacter intestinalis]
MSYNQPLLKARSPAALAEEYIVQSIWNNRFPPGSDLPAERELADKIGVTRTTLREVLQRLARDGWLNIQHGKPTKVNDVWQTSGLNILEVLVRLDSATSPALIANMLSARTNIASIYVPKAFKIAGGESQAIFSSLDTLEDNAQAYTAFDYHLFHKLAFTSGNPIYGLILNSLKALYTRVGHFYFSRPQARALAYKFYSDLKIMGEHQAVDEIAARIRQYGKESAVIWTELKDELLDYLIE